LPSGGFALIRRSTAIEESQSEGVPIWKHGKTSARDAWRKIEPTFAHIAATMGVVSTQPQGVNRHGN
jgi:chromosome partitioning protein